MPRKQNHNGKRNHIQEQRKVILKMTGYGNDAAEADTILLITSFGGLAGSDDMTIRQECVLVEKKKRKSPGMEMNYICLLPTEMTFVFLFTYSIDLCLKT